MRKYFGTDGIRDVANTVLSPELALKVAKAGAYVLSKHAGDKMPTILIGKDTRISGDVLEAAMISGFCSFGANVIVLGVIPTPAVAYLIKKYNADAGVVISASHNPYEFNGIKYFSKEGTKLPDEMEEEIEDLMDSEEYNNLSKSGSKIGRYEFSKTAEDDYVNFLTNIVEPNIKNIDKSNLTIGIDTANGATYSVAKKVLEKLGINYKIINDKPDGININNNCGSTHINVMKQFVKENNLSLGLCFDGDGDRCLAVDELGEEVDGDKLISIFSNYMKEKGTLKKDTAVVTVMSNLGITKYAKENGINIERTKVGDRYVLEKMKQDGFNIGGEQSGHVILLDHISTGDGILSGIKLLEIMLVKNKRVSELASIMKKFPQVLINVKVSNDKKYNYDKDEIIINAIKNLEEEFNDTGRVLIRASGTEPLVRVMIEGEDQEYIEQKAKEIAKIIEERMN